jgi:hypothetical protein
MTNGMSFFGNLANSAHNNLRLNFKALLYIKLWYLLQGIVLRESKVGNE